MNKQEKKYLEDALVFSDVLSKTKLKDTTLRIGNFCLKGRIGTTNVIQYNNEDFELLNHKHEYTFPLFQGVLQISLQLYLNIKNYYRLFCYTKYGNKSGMTFSVNLTTEKESDNIIYLTQKIRFSERYGGDKNLEKAHRRRKQMIFMDMISKLGIEVTENQDVILGVFDPEIGKFINTNRHKFLNDFLSIALLKGHFQGNKGYQLEILPNYNNLDYIYNYRSENSKVISTKNTIQKKRRIIPLGMRYKIFSRDGFSCVACGRSAKDGIQLHVDHKIPFSLGGLTVYDNLQTLCNECNISKSNKYTDV